MSVRRASRSAFGLPPLPARGVSPRGAASRAVPFGALGRFVVASCALMASVAIAEPASARPEEPSAKERTRVAAVRADADGVDGDRGGGSTRSDFAAPPPAVAQDGDRGRGEWRPRRDLRFGTLDFVVTGAAAGVVVAAAVIEPQESRWRGGILFDEDARDALRVSSLHGRYAVRDASDVGVSLMSTWPFLVDALITAWWYRGRADLARRMAFVSAEAFALGAAVQGTANWFGSRERPFGRLCGQNLDGSDPTRPRGIPEDSVDCGPNVRYRSFFSGHTTLAFVSAGLLCTHHLGLGLLGRAGDVATCAGGVAVATMTSVFRIMSDMHYASDVAVGALVGTAAGVLVPLVHLTPASSEPTAGEVDLRIAPVGQGLGVVGTF